jgi:hypothetical protein
LVLKISKSLKSWALRVLAEYVKPETGLPDALRATFDEFKIGPGRTKKGA